MSTSKNPSGLKTGKKRAWIKKSGLFFGNDFFAKGAQTVLWACNTANLKDIKGDKSLSFAYKWATHFGVTTFALDVRIDFALNRGALNQNGTINWDEVSGLPSYNPKYTGNHWIEISPTGKLVKSYDTLGFLTRYFGNQGLANKEYPNGYPNDWLRRIYTKGMDILF